VGLVVAVCKDRFQRRRASSLVSAKRNFNGGDSAWVFANPNGIESFSPGLRVPRRSEAKAGGASYPGLEMKMIFNPNGVVSVSF
jgi:hypothetical protein